MTAADRGSTLLEVLVAMLLLVISVVGACELAVLASQSAITSRLATTTMALALQKSEQLRALTWAVDADGVPLTDTHTDVTVEPFATAGSGTGVSPPGTLEESVGGFADALDARSRWVAAGTSLPPPVVYARRWSLEERNVGGTSVLVHRVFVAPLTDADRSAATTGAMLGLDAGLVSLRSRTRR